ncbi:MAG: SH3 domain-containing protein [bacterium]|nr:SH3 domain-containing protein [bacterium]
MRQWHLLSVVVVLALNTIGLGMVYLRLNKPLQMSATASLEAVRLNTAEISDKLVNIQDQLTRLQTPQTNSILGLASAKSDQLSDLLPDIPNSATSVSLRYISVSEDFTDSVVIYKEQADFSSVIGQLVPGQKYPFSTKLSDWYQINLSGGKTGWVKAAHVHEVL